MPKKKTKKKTVASSNERELTAEEIQAAGEELTEGEEALVQGGAGTYQKLTPGQLNPGALQPIKAKPILKPVQVVGYCW